MPHHAPLPAPAPPGAPQDAIKAVQAEVRAKFDESLELHMCLGIDPRRGDQVRQQGAVGAAAAAPWAPLCAVLCYIVRERAASAGGAV